MRGFARVGIIALVDEATGYRYYTAEQLTSVDDPRYKDHHDYATYTVNLQHPDANVLGVSRGVQKAVHALRQNRRLLAEGDCAPLGSWWCGVDV